MFLYANGCSWTAGNGIEKDPALDSVPELDRSSYWKKLSWPAQLASLMNCSFINDAEGGGSNQRILRLTTKFVREWPEDQRDELIVIIGWTSIERGELFVSYDGVEQWCRFNMLQKFSNNWSKNSAPWPKDILHTLDQYQQTHVRYTMTSKNSFNKFFQEVYLLSNLLESLSIKYIFFSSIGGLNFPEEPIIIDKEYPQEVAYLKNPKFMNLHNDSMSLFCYKNSLQLSDCCHPMINSHHEWAKHLFETYNQIYNKDFQ